MEKWVKIGLGLGLLYYGILQGAKGLVIRVYSFAFKGVNLADNTVSLSLNLLVKNPLLVGLTLKAISGDVYVQGNRVGYVNTTYDYYLGGGMSHVIPVVVNLNMSDVGQAALLNIQTGAIQNLTISFDGKVYVGSMNVPIPLQLDLNYKDLVG